MQVINCKRYSYLIDQKKIVKDDSIRAEMIAPCLYGALLVVAGVLALSLPETNNLPLPVTIKEAVKTHVQSKKR